MPESTVPWLQSVFDLMNAVATTDARAMATVEGWSRRTGLALPAAVSQFYTTRVRIPLTDGGAWHLPLPELWREFSGEAELLPLGEVLAGLERAGRSGSSGPVADPVPAQWPPLVYFERDVMAVHHVFFAADGTDDPAVHAHSRDPFQQPGWSREGERFSGWIFDWFASYYDDDQCPASFWGPEATVTFEQAEERHPDLPYRNGLWARAVDLPVGDPVLADLSRRFGPARRRSWAGGATRYSWPVPGGTLQVTTDPPDHGGSRADHDGSTGSGVPAEGGGPAGSGSGAGAPVGVWWLHGTTTEVFRRLLSALWGHPTLARTLRNSDLCVHAEGREIIASLRA